MVWEVETIVRAMTRGVEGFLEKEAPSQASHWGNDVTGIRGDGETERIPFSSWGPSHTEPDVASVSFSAQGTSNKHDTAPLCNLVHIPVTILSD